MAYEYLLILPPISALAWFVAGVALIDRPPFGALPGRFFITFCLVLSGYALFDWQALLASTAADALFQIRLSYVAATFAVALMFIATRRMAGKRGNWDLASLVAGFLAIPAIMGPLVPEATATSWGYRAVVRAEFYVPWLLMVVTLAILGIYYLLRRGTLIRRAWRRDPRALTLFAGSLVALLLLSIASNVLGSLSGAEVPRLISSFLFLPAIAVTVLSLRATRTPFAQAVGGLFRQRYSVLQGFLVFRGGKLIASKTSGRGAGVDQDMMTGMLDAVQSFLGQSFPLIEDGTLRAIEQADVRLLVEKGRLAYLVLVIQGREDQVFRSLMADALRRFEIEHFDFLMDWKGDTADIPDCDPVFQPFFPDAMAG